MPIYLVNSKKKCTFAAQFGVLAHLVERNTGSVEVSGSSPLYSTTPFNRALEQKTTTHFCVAAFFCFIDTLLALTAAAPWLVGIDGAVVLLLAPTIFVTLCRFRIVKFVRVFAAGALLVGTEWDVVLLVAFAYQFHG